MHPRSHAILLNNYYKYLPLFILFMFITLIPVLIITRSIYIVFIWIGIIILLNLDIPWRLTVRCETPNCNSSMVIARTKIPAANQARVAYRCLSCGSVYETIIYYRERGDTNIPGEW